MNDDILYFNLSNSKPLQPVLAKNKNGIGLSNVQKRLALLYPDKHRLKIITAGDVFNVRMEIELQTKAVT